MCLYYADGILFVKVRSIVVTAWCYYVGTFEQSYELWVDTLTCPHLLKGFFTCILGTVFLGGSSTISWNCPWQNPCAALMSSSSEIALPVPTLLLPTLV